MELNLPYLIYMELRILDLANLSASDVLMPVSNKKFYSTWIHGLFGHFAFLQFAKMLTLVRIRLCLTVWHLCSYDYFYYIKGLVPFTQLVKVRRAHVAGAWTERQKMFLGGSFLKLADDDV